MKGECLLRVSDECHDVKRNRSVCKASWHAANLQEQESLMKMVPKAKAPSAMAAKASGPEIQDLNWRTLQAACAKYARTWY